MNRFDKERYARQMVLPGVGEQGQRKLAAGRVLVIGAGGLGSPAALYLVAAGVGRVDIMDPDTVQFSNLNLQILHGTPDLGKSKVASAVRKLKALNPGVRVKGTRGRLEAGNARAHMAAYDFILDCTDNFDSKFLIADACFAEGKPYSHAGITGMVGQTMTVIPGVSACYRCVFGKPPQRGVVLPPAEAGVLGPAPGVIGAVQAAEAIKFLTGTGALLTDRLLSVDLARMETRVVGVQRNPRCPLCGRRGKGGGQ